MRKVLVAAIGLALAATALVGLAIIRGEAGQATADPTPINAEPQTTSETTTTEPDVEGPLGLEVDSTVEPGQGFVAGLEPGDDPRPVGRIVFDDGQVSDLVLGELIVATADQTALDDFVARYQGEVLDTFAGVDGDPSEYLIRVALPAADPAGAAEALVALEPDHSGDYRISDPSLVSMIDIAATETIEEQFEVSLNWLASPMGIAEGDVEEAFDRANPFEWSYLRVGGPLDTGVTGAWQLIEQHGRADHLVHIAIADGGFFENDDFPFQRKIRLGDWNVANPKDCTGGSPCPWHGTDVALTAMAEIDNGFGTAGVAGQVGALIAVEMEGDFWTQMRKLKKVVDEERPAVVNMSFGMTVKAFRNASQSSVDRHIKAMRDDGALVFAAAGNDGNNVDGTKCVFSNCYENRLIIPCESKYAICVGGTQSGTPWLHDSSNYGTAGGNRSVEIYAPYCVVSLFNPVSQVIDDTKRVCGTSFSSPFVAGAAALVEAADPSLSDGEIWEILRDTAHVGGVHFDHYIATEHQLRINVLDAVAMALGVEQTAPEVVITSPADGHEVGITDWFELEASAVDFKGEPLMVEWVSSIEGELGASIDELTVFELTAGIHQMTASATDVNGNTTSDQTTVVVTDLPPEMGISWPAPGSLVYETEKITLVGSSEDPDTYQPLGDQDVHWEIVRNGHVELTKSGHTATIAPETLAPGSYQVVFRGHDTGGSGEAEITVEVLEVVGNLPVAEITTDFDDQPYGSHNGTAIEFTLNGTGTDVEDGTLSGTRFRWIARADNGYEEVLCTGSTFSEAEAPDNDGEFNPGLTITPPAGPTRAPVIGILNDCKTIDVELGLAPGKVGETVWAIVLEVSDSDGQVGRDVAKVSITFVTG